MRTDSTTPNRRRVRLGKTDKILLRAAADHSRGAVSVSPKWRLGIKSLRKLLFTGYLQEKPGWEMEEPFGGVITDKGRKANGFAELPSGRGGHGSK